MSTENKVIRFGESIYDSLVLAELADGGTFYLESKGDVAELLPIDEVELILSNVDYRLDSPEFQSILPDLENSISLSSPYQSPYILNVKGGDKDVVIEAVNAISRWCTEEDITSVYCSLDELAKFRFDHKNHADGLMINIPLWDWDVLSDEQKLKTTDTLMKIFGNAYFNSAALIINIMGADLYKMFPDHDGLGDSHGMIEVDLVPYEVIGDYLRLSGVSWDSDQLWALIRLHRNSNRKLTLKCVRELAMFLSEDSSRDFLDACRFLFKEDIYEITEVSIDTPDNMRCIANAVADDNSYRMLITAVYQDLLTDKRTTLKVAVDRYGHKSDLEVYDSETTFKMDENRIELDFDISMRPATTEQLLPDLKPDHKSGRLNLTLINAA